MKEYLHDKHIPSTCVIKAHPNTTAFSCHEQGRTSKPHNSFSLGFKKPQVKDCQHHALENGYYILVHIVL